MILDRRPHPAYFADPMCSWCLGFDRILADVEKKFDLPVHVVLGDLRREVKGLAALRRNAPEALITTI